MTEFHIESRFHKSARHTTHYLAAGPEDGPLLVFVHGRPELSLSTISRIKNRSARLRAHIKDPSGTDFSRRTRRAMAFHRRKVSRHNMSAPDIRITVPDQLIDYCTTVPTPDQCDTDGDGFGNLCDGDFNNSGFVNAADLAIFKACFGTANVDSDLDGSGFVNAADLAIFKSLFGKVPGPSGLKP